jgi:DNA adenine methylase Dam
MGWVGGKKRFAAQIAGVMPDEILAYTDLFTGSGAIPLYLAANRRIVRGADIRLADIPPVANVWRQVVDVNMDLNSALLSLESLQVAYEDLVAHVNADYFLKKEASLGLDAAVVLLVNQLCFNNLWRTNSSGAFNTSRGSAPGINAKKIIDRVQRVRDLLSPYCVTVYDDWRLAARHAAHVVYADPPYLETFSSYGQARFDRNDHVELACELQSQRFGVVVASNSDCDEARRLYAPPLWNVMRIARPNNVSCKAETRGESRGEILAVRA